MTRQIQNISQFNSRTYNIVIEEFTGGTAFAEVLCKRKYKHGIHKWNKTHQKKNDEMFFRWIQPSHCLIDDVQDYIDYYDCLSKLKYSNCARRWFRQKLQPYIEMHFYI